MTLSPDELKRIEERAEKATDGAWEVDTEGDSGDWGIWHETGSAGCELIARININRTYNADFIAHARKDIPALLAHVRKLEASTKELEAEREKYKGLEEAARDIESIRGHVIPLTAHYAGVCEAFESVTNALAALEGK